MSDYGRCLPMLVYHVLLLNRLILEEEKMEVLGLYSYHALRNNSDMFRLTIRFATTEFGAVCFITKAAVWKVLFYIFELKWRLLVIMLLIKYISGVKKNWIVIFVRVKVTTSPYKIMLICMDFILIKNTILSCFYPVM